MWKDGFIKEISHTDPTGEQVEEALKIKEKTYLSIYIDIGL
ncbi:hypothetical protein [Priestia megaterium]